MSVKLKSENIDKGLLDEKLLSYKAVILIKFYKSKKKRGLWEVAWKTKQNKTVKFI